MKTTGLLLIGFILSLGLSSCGVNRAQVFNQNQNNTQVQLNQNNFKVSQKIQGSAEVSYVLFFGGAKRTQLYREAYQNMLDEAGLEGSSKAITNVLTEEHVGGVPPFYYTRTVTVSAYVVEFE
ncbi:MAG: hypothetical protein HWE24_16740 [Oceanospirillaceae bacterium]|nr:hypothetical protein [Oceanospirillaceae bacterium]